MYASSGFFMGVCYSLVNNVISPSVPRCRHVFGNRCDTELQYYRTQLELII